MKKLIVIILFLIIQINIFAIVNFDSLYISIPPTKDTNRVKALVELVIQIKGYDNEKAVQYGTEAINLAEPLNYTVGLAEAYYYRGIAFYFMGDNAKAKSDFGASLQYREQLGDKEGIADLLILQGIIMDSYSQHDKALEIYFQALEQYKAINSRNGLSVAYSNIATSYNRIHKYKEALRFQRMSLQINLEMQNWENAAISYYDMGICYDNMNENEQSLLFYDSAAYYYRKSFSKQGLSSVYNNKGVVYKKIKLYDKALTNFLSATRLQEEVHHRYGLANTLCNIGEVYVLTKNPDAALVNLEKSLAIAEEIGSNSIRENCYYYLSNAYKLKGQYLLALDYFERYSQLHDSIAEAATKDKMVELQAFFNNEQNENEITMLQQIKQINESRITRQRYLLLFSIILLFIFSALIYLWYQKYRDKKKSNAILNHQYIQIQQQNQEIEKQKASIEAQALQLQELNEFKSRFFANISHEFRTPLTLILGPLEQLIEKTDKTDLREKYFLMYRNAERLHNLINQLLALSKIEKGQVHLQLSRFHFNEFLKAVISNFQLKAKHKNIDLQFIDANQTFECVADIEKLETVFINLISNALKFTPSGGFVHVKLELQGSNFIVSIKDSGKGIAKNNIPYIFVRFYQIEDRENVEIGTGLGLSIVKEFVTLHNGLITVSSDLGKGSEFIVTLPVEAQGEVAISVNKEIAETITFQQLETKTNLIVDSQKPTVLVVEDNADLREYIKSQLQEHFNVLFAINGKEGLEMALEHYPDCIVSDVMMPLMNGFEMTQKLKEDVLISHIPVILLTAKSSEQSVIEGLNTDADGYITKPFKTGELIARIHNIIRNRRKLKEKFEKSITVQPSEVSVTSADEKFIAKALHVVEQNMMVTDFDVEQFCEAIGMSRTNLHRKLKAITNQSTTEFIRSVRMKRAAQLFQQKAGSISEIAYQVGFNNLSYFTRCFKEYYNVTPSDFLQA